LDFWGTVSDVVQEGGEEELPADDDPQVGGGRR